MDIGNKEEIRGFMQAIKVCLAGMTMWEPIYEVYTSRDNKVKYYVGEDRKWYISNIGRELETIREITMIEKGTTNIEKKNLIDSLKKQLFN